jgi:hypothetical protein
MHSEKEISPRSLATIMGASLTLWSLIGFGTVAALHQF